jgi:hypothetical protein
MFVVSWQRIPRIVVNVPVPFKVLLIRQTDDGQEVCAGEISDDDWRLFTAFRDYAVGLESAEWVRAGLDSHYSASQASDGVMKIDAPNKPSDTAVRELLHLMRPFLLQNEATWYPKINGRLYAYLDHPYLRKELATGRRIFDHGSFHLYGQITINDLPLHDERTFSLWLNAFEYHRDPKKRAELTSAFRGPPDDFALAVFRSILADRAAEVMKVAAMITSIENARSSQVKDGCE